MLVNTIQVRVCNHLVSSVAEINLADKHLILKNNLPQYFVIDKFAIELSMLMYYAYVLRFKNTNTKKQNYRCN